MTDLKKIMKKKWVYIIGGILVVLLAISSCSSGPSNDVVKNAIINQNKGWGESNSLIHLDSFDITNKWTQDVNGEKVYFFDYTAQITGPLTKATQSGHVAIVKHGDEWYSYTGNEE